jgi:hypothetical protein
VTGNEICDVYSIQNSFFFFFFLVAAQQMKFPSLAEERQAQRERTERSSLTVFSSCFVPETGRDRSLLVSTLSNGSLTVHDVAPMLSEEFWSDAATDAAYVCWAFFFFFFFFFSRAFFTCTHGTNSPPD